MMQQFNKFTSRPRTNGSGSHRLYSRVYLTRVLYNSNLKKGRKRRRPYANWPIRSPNWKGPAHRRFRRESVKKLYQEWLDDEELIRKAYQDAGGKSLVSRPGRRPEP